MAIITRTPSISRSRGDGVFDDVGIFVRFGYAPIQRARCYEVDILEVGKAVGYRIDILGFGESLRYAPFAVRCEGGVVHTYHYRFALILYERQIFA